MFWSNRTLILAAFLAAGGITGYVAGRSEASVGGNLIGLISGILGAVGYSMLVRQEQHADIDKAIKAVPDILPGQADCLRRNLGVPRDYEIVPRLWLGGLALFAFGFLIAESFGAESRLISYPLPPSNRRDNGIDQPLDTNQKLDLQLVRLRCKALRMTREDYDVLMTSIGEALDAGKTTSSFDIFNKLGTTPHPRSAGTLGG
jgi:hypothetical protein